MSKDKKLSRRDFLKESSVVTAGVSLGLSKVGIPVYAKTLNANEVIRIGVIGTGSRGNYLMDEIRKLVNVEITDLCDIYQPNLQQAFERNGKKGRLHNDYRKLLEQKDIDAVFVVTPLVFHIPQSLDAVSLGKHVFCEKSLAYSVKEANKIVEAVNYYGVKFLVGYSRWSNMTDEIKKLIKSGAIGKIHHIFTHYHRNNTWARNVDDPKWFRRLNWRLYWEYCGGQMTDLVSHQINTVNYVLDSHPISAVGTGAVDFYTQYDRETWDNVDVVFEYPDHIKVNSTSNFMNAKMGTSIEYLGTNGTIEPGGRGEIRLYWETATEHLASIGIKTGQVNIKLGETLKVDESPNRIPGKVIKVERGEERNLVAHFFDCIRNNKEPVINVEEGRGSSITCLMANQAIRLGRKVTWDEMLSMG
jgi:predicted dehydrogenase